QWPVLSVAADCAGHGLPADRIQPGRALEGMGILLALHPGIFRNTAAGDSTRWAGRGCDCLRRGACRRAAQSLGFQYRAVLAAAADCAWTLDAGAAGAGPGSDSVVDGLGVLGGFQRRVTAQNFSGGNLTACFGGFNVDLTRAGISGERAVIDITACFGGGEIRVPNSWIVDLRGQGFFGAFQDESRQTPAEGAKTLVVTGIALFGGVVIKD